MPDTGGIIGLWPKASISSAGPSSIGSPRGQARLRNSTASGGTRPIARPRSAVSAASSAGVTALPSAWVAASASPSARTS